MSEDEAMRARIKKINGKVFMASEWLYKKTKLLELLGNLNVKAKENITYHDPCHARKVLKVFKEPRALLGVNYNIKEMSDPAQCCGFGGVTMQSEKFTISQKAGTKKTDMIKDTNAKVVSAECGACRMQLTNALDKVGIDTAFKHPLELIAEVI
jgi:glycolate oxidase iron-sulfur subunit